MLLLNLTIDIPFHHLGLLEMLRFFAVRSNICKARYAVLFQIWTLSSKPEDEAHIGPTATYDEVIYLGFQHDITTLQIQGYTSHTIGIQLPEYNTTTEDTCLSTNYKQMPNGKGKTHHAHVSTMVQALRRGP